MADGIVFFKSKNYSGFDESEETIKFTLLLNSIFDALNRKFSAEGIKKNSQDIKVYKYICVLCAACFMFCSSLFNSSYINAYFSFLFKD